MFTALVVAGVLSDLPFPLSEIKFDEKQSKAVERITAQYALRAKPLEAARDKAKGNQRQKVDGEIAKLLSKRDDEITKLLNEDQREKIAQYREKGVPVSDGFYRTSAIVVTKYDISQFETMHSVKVRCDLRNLSGKNFKEVNLEVQILDESGKQVGAESVFFEDFTDGKTFEVKLDFRVEADWFAVREYKLRIKKLLTK